MPRTAVQNEIWNRELHTSDAEPQEVEIGETINNKSVTSGFNNVLRELGDGKEEYRQLGREAFVKYLGSTSRYISDICVPQNSTEIIQFLDDVRQLSGASAADQLRLVSVHDTHIHVVHTCAYSNSACRCTWLSGSAIWRNRRIPKHRRRVFAADITASEWKAIFRYFSSNGHTIQNIESRGPNGRIYLRLKALQVTYFYKYFKI